MIRLISYKYNGSLEYTAEEDLEILNILENGELYETVYLSDNIKNESRWYVSPNFYNELAKKHEERKRIYNN